MIIRPLAKLLSVFCKAKAMTNPAAPMTRDQGCHIDLQRRQAKQQAHDDGDAPDRINHEFPEQL